MVLCLCGADGLLLFVVILSDHCQTVGLQALCLNLEGNWDRNLSLCVRSRSKADRGSTWVRPVRLYLIAKRYQSGLQDKGMPP